MDNINFLPYDCLGLLNSLTEDDFVVSLPPQPSFELPVSGGDLVVVFVLVVAISTGSKVNEGLGLTDGKRVFLPSSMSRSKTNPMAAARCGV